MTATLAPLDPEHLHDPLDGPLDDGPAHVYVGVGPGELLRPGQWALCGHRFAGPARPGIPVDEAGPLCAACALLR